MAGIDMLHVPYKEQCQAVTDLLGGQISLSSAMFRSAATCVGWQAEELRSVGHQAFTARAGSSDHR